MSNNPTNTVFSGNFTGHRTGFASGGNDALRILILGYTEYLWIYTCSQRPTDLNDNAAVLAVCASSPLITSGGSAFTTTVDTPAPYTLVQIFVGDSDPKTRKLRVWGRR